MHLEQVLASRTKLKILRSLAEVPRQLSASELAEETGTSRSGVYQNLRDLQGAGVVEALGRGRGRSFRLARNHALFPILRRLFDAEADLQGIEHLPPAIWNRLDPIVADLAASPGVQFTLLYGSVVTDRFLPGSDIDILVATTEPTALPNLPDGILGHALSIVPMDPDAFWRNAAAGDPFVENVLERHVVLHRDPDREPPVEDALPPM